MGIALKKLGVYANDSEILTMMKEYDFVKTARIQFEEFKEMMLDDTNPNETQTHDLDTLNN